MEYSMPIGYTILNWNSYGKFDGLSMTVTVTVLTYSIHNS